MTAKPALHPPTQSHTILMTTARVIILNISLGGLWRWLRQLSICLQCRRPGFNPRVKNISWRRTWQPTPVFLPGESPRMEEPAGCSPWGREELDTTERQSSTQRSCSFLQNPRLPLPPEHPGPWRRRCPAQPRTRTSAFALLSSWNAFPPDPVWLAPSHVSLVLFACCLCRAGLWLHFWKLQALLRPTLFILSTCFIFPYRIFIIWHVGYILLFIVCV